MIFNRQAGGIWIILLLLFIGAGSVFPAYGETAKEERFVSIDFNDVDIRVFIKFVSELTSRNFVIDQRVKGKVSIVSPSKISVEEAYRVFESVLEVHGYATVRAGEVTKIVPAPDARSKNIETRLKEEGGEPEDRVITQLIQLKYADPVAIKKLLTPLVSKNSVILAYQPTNMLMVTDLFSNITRISKIIKAIDVAGVGMEITVIPLQHANATEFVKILTTIFKSQARVKKGTSPTGASAQFVADNRTNSVIAMANRLEVERVNGLISLLDRQVPKSEEKIRVYYLENASSEDMAKVLNDLVGGVTQAKEKAGKQKAPIVSEKVKITPDKETNSLIIMAGKDDFPVIEDIIRKLDITRAMVYIECLIMEVNVDAEFNLGTQWQIGAETQIEGKEGAAFGGFRGDDTTMANLSKGVTPQGFSMGMFNEGIEIGDVTFPSVGAVVNAYKGDKDVNILSTPQILTLDNKKARIHVGENRPYLTKQEANTSSTETVFNSFEYKDVGISLEVTPQINKDGQVRLEIAQELTKLDSTSTSTIQTPTTLKRTIDTTIVVQNGKTVVLGGLIDDTFTINEKKVPGLGDVPFLGWLFKTKTRNKEKKNLYVFMTPQVVKNPGDSTKIYMDKKERIEKIRRGSIQLFDGEKEKE